MPIGFSFLYPLYSIDPRSVWKGQLAVLIAVAGAVALMMVPLNPDSRVLRWLKICGVAGIAVMALLQFGILIRYLFYPSYINHGEAMTAAISWLAWEDYPLYPRLDTGDVYGIPYGPVVFQTTGFFLWLFGPSVATSKILGLSAFSLAQVLSIATLRRAGAGLAEALTITGVQCLVLAGFTPEGVVSGVRPDALLLLAAQTAVLLGTSMPSILTAGALGLLAGISLDLRIDGALYILPVFVYCLARSPDASTRLRLICTAVLAFASASIVPFIPDNVSLSEYRHYFQVMSHHPWERWLFEQNILFIGMLLIPHLCTYALFTPKLAHALKWFLAAVVLSMALVSFPAAESGAGPHHLLPFLPSVVWSYVVMRKMTSAGLPDSRTRGRYEGLSLVLIAALLFGYGPIVITSWSAIFNRFAYAPLVAAAAAEVNNALAENPGLKIAVGAGRASVDADPAAFDAEMLRVIPVFRGNPLPIDSTVWMNFEAEGISDDLVRRAITECRVDLWLLPSGAPLVKISHYNGKNIFSPEVLADFHASYRKQRSGRVFDQWRCTRSGGGKPE